MKRIIKNNAVFLLFFASAVVVMLVSVFTSRMMTSSAQMIEETSKREMVALSRAAAELATADELDRFMVPEDMELPEYLQLKEKLIEFNDSAGLAFTYYLRLDTGTNMMQFIIDNTPEDFTALSVPQVAREKYPDIALEGTANAVDLGSYSDGWEGYLTAYAPVYYSDGRLSNIVAGVDMQDIYIHQARDNTYTMSVVFIVAQVLILGICLFCMLLYRKKARQSEVASVSKSAFLSNMSHEMRTPMNAIIGMTEIAKNADPPERVKYCLDKIDGAAGHLLGVINDVLDISKIESGKFVLDSTDFVLEKMLQRVMTVINFRVDEKKQQFYIKIDKDVPNAIVADEQRLTQVITNLLANAVKFTPEGGRIGLEVQNLYEAAGVCTLQFTVSDTGIGIGDEQQKKLFHSFQQADGSISRRFGGTGLGLSISKNIVEMMGGNIWVQSRLGAGSRFHFTIKAWRGTAQSSARLDPAINWNALRILAVDDRPEELEYLQDVTAGLGLHCDTARDGFTACRMLAEQKGYDILFIDWNMPGMNGIDLTREVRRAIGNGCVVIMVSATEWTLIQDDALAAGVDLFLPKPLLPSAIVACLNSCAGDRPAGERTPAAEKPGTKDIFAGKHILLAEDIDINREILAALLEDTGVSLDSAENGIEACSMFSQNPGRYDLILMDIHMPEMDGYEATRQIRASGAAGAAAIPIVAMTANVFKEDIDRCLAAGMNDHLGKPIDIDEAIAKLRHYLLPQPSACSPAGQ